MVNAQRSNSQPHKAQRLARSDARSCSARSRLRAGQDSGQRAFGRFNGLVRDDFSPWRSRLRASRFQCNIANIVTEDLRDYLNAMHIRPVALNNHQRLIELERLTRDDSD
jgi:hypothetical protein